MRMIALRNLTFKSLEPVVLCLKFYFNTLLFQVYLSNSVSKIEPVQEKVDVESSAVPGKKPVNYSIKILNFQYN